MTFAYSLRLVPASSSTKSSISKLPPEEKSKIKCELGYGSLLRPPENHRYSYSGLSNFFSYLALRNQALFYSYQDYTSEGRCHLLACGKRDDLSEYALRQGEIQSNNMKDFARLILESDLSSLEVLFPLLWLSLFSLDKQQAAATFVFWTIYDGFRSSTYGFAKILMHFEELIMSVDLDKSSHVLQCILLGYVMVLFYVAERFSQMRLTHFLGHVLYDNSSKDELSTDFKPVPVLSASVLNLVRLSAHILLKHSVVFQSLAASGVMHYLKINPSSLMILMDNGDSMKIKPVGLPSILLGSLSQPQEVFYSDFNLLELEVDLNFQQPFLIFYPMEGNAEDTDFDRMKFFFHCQVHVQGKSQDYGIVLHLIVAHSGWFRCILEFLYCSLPRPPEENRDFNQEAPNTWEFTSKMKCYKSKSKMEFPS